MAITFRKSFRILPGVRLNINRRSWSVTTGGGRGPRRTVSSTGRRTTSWTCRARSAGGGQPSAQRLSQAATPYGRAPRAPSPPPGDDGGAGRVRARGEQSFALPGTVALPSLERHTPTAASSHI
ncbi:hypothetical protein SBADM41S_04919 [Streptomyces badius]